VALLILGIVSIDGRVIPAGVQFRIDTACVQGGYVVQKDEIVKGYEHQKGEYVIIEPSELEQLRVPSKHYFPPSSVPCGIAVKDPQARLQSEMVCAPR
jgi:hypothetical protein